MSLPSWVASASLWYALINCVPSLLLLMDRKGPTVSQPGDRPKHSRHFGPRSAPMFMSWLEGDRNRTPLTPSYSEKPCSVCHPAAVACATPRCNPGCDSHRCCLKRSTDGSTDGAADRRKALPVHSWWSCQGQGLQGWMRGFCLEISKRCTRAQGTSSHGRFNAAPYKVLMPSNKARELVAN